MQKCEKIIKLTRQFARKMSDLELEYDGYVYNPLIYARGMHEEYLEIAIRENQKVFIMGMNPGPFGMCQTGVPFGDVVHIREYLKIDGEIGKPKKECPLRPIEGMNIGRQEMSGKRIWGTVSELYDRDEFFSFATISNYCPLCFLDDKGRNVTPDKLPLCDRKAIYRLSDEYLKEVLTIINPSILVGVGNFAAKKLEPYGKDVRVLPHPSPLNRGSGPFYNSPKAKEYFIGLHDDACLCEG